MGVVVCLFFWLFFLLCCLFVVFCGGFVCLFGFWSLSSLVPWCFVGLQYTDGAGGDLTDHHMLLTFDYPAIQLTACECLN